MKVHAGAAVGPFGQDAREERYALPLKLLCYPLHCDGLDEWVGHYDFFFRQRGRVSVVSGFDVSLQQLTNSRQAGQKIAGETARHWAQFFSFHVGRRRVFEAFVNLLLQPFPDRIHEGGGLDLQFRGVNRFVIEETRKNQAQQVGRNGGNGRFRRQIFPVKMVDAADARIRSQKPVSQLGNRDVVHGGSIPQSQVKGKRRPKNEKAGVSARRLSEASIQTTWTILSCRSSRPSWRGGPARPSPVFPGLPC